MQGIYYRRKVLIAVQMNYFKSDAFVDCSVCTRNSPINRRFRRHTFHLRLSTNILVMITHCYDITSFLFLYRHFPIKRWICMGMSLKNKRNTNRFLNCCFWIVPRWTSYTVTKQFVLILQWQSPFELTFQSVNSFESIPQVKLKWPHSNNSS